jgi:CheY-like chemotaxis protein
MGPKVLIVESEPETRARLREWLEMSGMWAMTCPGPPPPCYECPISNGEPCPYVESVDAIVLDGTLDSDRAATGTPAMALAVSYAATGKPLVVLADSQPPPADPNVSILPRAASRRRVVKAVRTLLDRP